MTHWLNPPDNIYDKLGFIYCITNNTNNRKYIGQKKIWFSGKLAPLKGKKQTRRIFYESGWRIYTGSSKTLTADIKKLGIENFTFEILRYCYSKFQLHYYELKEQVDRGVMLSDEYYNALIRVYISKPKYLPKPFTMVHYRGKNFIKTIDK